ncbi:MAG: hydrogenase maturation protease [Actinomycetota bacterium]
MRVLVAGVGNVLRGDDGFGVVVAQRLLEGSAPQGVRVMETGIGGIHLVQELMDPVDALIIVDAMDVCRPAGTVVVQRPHVIDVDAMTPEQRRDQLADMHYSTPERALMLARAIGVLPESAWVVGCQPAELDRLGEGLSEVMEAAVDVAIREVKAVVSDMGVAWP